MLNIGLKVLNILKEISFRNNYLDYFSGVPEILKPLKA